ncbi:MAG: alpha/beta hydrolase-fold protein [Mariniphaga sp.]
MKNLLIAILILISGTINAQNVQKVMSGRIDHLENFPSKLVEPRSVDIWLPEGYDGKKKFDVLYMHDGQMLFDSTTTWNHQSWNVDDVASKLMNDKKIQNFIIVGIYSIGEKRHANYFPQQPFDNLTKTEKDTVVKQLQKSGRTSEIFQPNSDNYLKFIATELKPLIDKNYAVYTNRKHTYIAGSSMGGLISMYAICEYPSIFGGAACLSTHWLGTFSPDNNPVPEAFIKYLKNNLPKPKNHKIYFDCGDKTLDVFYPPIQKKVDEVMMSKCYTNKNWMTQYFPGKDHSEKSWNERFEIPLRFLFKR